MAHDRRTFLRALGAGSIGTIGLSTLGGTVAASDLITIRAGGEDIWNQEDEFHYYYQDVSGDFDVAVRNTFLERTDDWAKVGIMARESLEANAANVMVRRNPDGEASLQWRPEAGAESDSNDLRAEGDWLRLEREGGTIRSYTSTDGENWTALTVLEPGDHGVALSDDLYLGLAVTSHNPGTLTTAEFRNLEGVSPTDNRDIGNVEVEGSVTVGTAVPFVETGEATDVTTESATLHGELTDLGGADSVTCAVQYREVPTAEWTTAGETTLVEPGSFSVDVSDLTARRYYQYRAVVEASNGEEAVGSIESFATETPSESDSSADGPASSSHFDLEDGFAVPAPWLDDDTPVIKITEPTVDQLERAFTIDGERLVVFETSGTIDLDVQNLTIPYDRCYVAGQTAPSPGITLVRGGLYVEADDCVVQHVRARPGDADQEEGSGWEPDAIHTGDDTSNNVIDHCSASWSIDECLSVGYDTVDTTVSNCLIGPALHEATHTKGNHGYGTLVGDGSDTVALLGNLWAHNRARNPRLKTGTESAVVNNVMYNFDEAATLDEDTEASIVGNAFVRVDEGDANVEGGRAYLEDNYSDPETEMADVDTVLEEAPLWPEGLEPMPTADVLEHALRNVGARPADRTAYDEELVRQVAERDGERIDSQEEVGGYPDLAVNTRELNVPNGATRAWLAQHARRVETTSD